MVMIEAMACGTPVVAFREVRPRRSSSRGSAGLLCDTLDEMVAAARQARTMRRRVQDRFSTERMVDRHVSVYRTLVQCHRRPGEAARAGENRTRHRRHAGDVLGSRRDLWVAPAWQG